MTVLAFATAAWQFSQAHEGLADSTGSRAAYVASSASAGPGEWARLEIDTPLTDLWFSFDFVAAHTSFNNSVARAAIGFGQTDLFRLWFDPEYANQFQMWDGAGWVNIGSTITASGQNRWDIHLALGAGGRIEIWRNGVLEVDWTGDTTVGGATALEFIRITSESTHSSYPAHWSAVFIADEPTPDLVPVERKPNGQGARNEWVGAYGLIDDVRPTYEQFIYSGTAGQVSTFTKGAFSESFPNGFIVTDVHVLAQAARSDTSPPNLQLVLRVGDVEDFSPAKALDKAVKAVRHTFEVNPATGAEFSLPEAEAAEFGVRSVA